MRKREVVDWELKNKKIHEPNGFKDCTQLTSPFIRESGKSYIS